MVKKNNAIDFITIVVLLKERSPRRSNTSPPLKKKPAPHQRRVQEAAGIGPAFLGDFFIGDDRGMYRNPWKIPWKIPWKHIHGM